MLTMLSKRTHRRVASISKENYTRIMGVGKFRFWKWNILQFALARRTFHAKLHQTNKLFERLPHAGDTQCNISIYSKKPGVYKRCWLGDSRDDGFSVSTPGTRYPGIIQSLKSEISKDIFKVLIRRIGKSCHTSVSSKPWQYQNKKTLNSFDLP